MECTVCTYVYIYIYISYKTIIINFDIFNLKVSMN